MSTYYIKGGSKFDEANPNVWVALHLAGFPSGNYLDTDWKDINDSGASNDPYWRLGGDGGQTEVEIGLSGGYGLKINENGISGYNPSIGGWSGLMDTQLHTHDGDTLQLDGINSNGGAFDFKTSGVLNLYPNNQIVDGLEVSVSGGVPKIKMIGNNTTDIESDQTWVQIKLFDVAANYFALGYDKTNNFSRIYCTEELNIHTSNDPDDYLQFYTSLNVPRIKVIGGDYFTIESDNSSAAQATFFQVVYDTTKLQMNAIHSATYTQIYSSTKLYIDTAQDINLRPSADTDNYFRFYASSDIVYFESVGCTLHIRAPASRDLRLGAGGSSQWQILSNGHLRPITPNVYNFGDATHEAAEVFHCGLTAGTCADFSQFNFQELKDILTWVPLLDIYEEMKDKTLLPHINMKTIHPLISHKYEGHQDIDTKEQFTSITKEYFKDGDGNTKGVTYNIGDGMAIDFENLSYAQNAMILKQYNKILELESRIQTLEA